MERTLPLHVIEAPEPKCTFSILFVLTRDGKLHFQIDYQKQITLTIRDSYLKLCKDECIAFLSLSTIFPSLNEKSQYWKIEITDQDRHKTPFTTKTRLTPLCTNVIYAGECLKDVSTRNGHPTDEGEMTGCLVYLDDIVFFSKKPDEQVEHVQQILTLQNDAGVMHNLSTCEFIGFSIDYLTQNISPGRLEVSTRERDEVHILGHLMDLK